MTQLFPFSLNNPAPNIKHIDHITDYGFISDGRDILDLGLGGSGCFPLGFKRTDIIEAVTLGTNTMPFCQSDFATTNTAVDKLSQQLFELSGGFDVIYSLSGSDAVEGAIKIAKMYNNKRHKIIGFENSYHGSTFMSSSVSGSTYFTDTFGRHPDCQIITYADLNNIDDTTLAVVIETCSWQNGLIPHTPEFWLELRQQCTDVGALLIIDDIAFCNGKTGTYFGWQVTGIVPDLFCIGKGITGGFFPLSATLINQRVSDKIRSQILLHGFTYSFPMPGILSALQYLKIVKEERILDNYEMLINTTSQLVEELKSLGLISGYRNFGVCFNLLLNTPLEDLWEKEALFYKHGLHMGIWNNYKDGILVSIPLNATNKYFSDLKNKLIMCFTEINEQN